MAVGAMWASPLHCVAGSFTAYQRAAERRPYILLLASMLLLLVAGARNVPIQQKRTDGKALSVLRFLLICSGAESDTEQQHSADDEKRDDKYYQHYKKLSLGEVLRGRVRRGERHDDNSENRQT